ncbi:MAG: SPOR domain-containing protein [Thiobacillus sp.]|nr:SPOR domain-containing protein [Thiobacillus sp.]
MAKSSPRSSGRSGGSSVFTGVLIGLTFGALLAVGIALWVTGTNPFNSAGPGVPPAGRPVTAPPEAPETAPSFDFYKVLPGEAPSEAQPAPQPPESKTLYYLQAGAFQNPADADNLKAQLALLGIETVIQTRDLGDKGVFHRVRVGPFNAMDQINRTRALLAQNNIPVTLVKEVPTTEETP